MNRRKFLKTSTAIALASGVQHSASALAPRAKKIAGRTVLPINRNWRYGAHATADAHQPGFDDASFTRVTVPHTNIPLPWHAFDDKDYEFVSLYRRRFKVPEGAAGKRVFVDFEGAMVASTVYLNGKKLGEYRGGYTPFTFELTQGLASDGNNLLSVELDSTERKDIPPFGHEVDYLTFGGIYREVALRIVPPVFLDNIHAQTRDVLGNPSLDVACYLDRPPAAVVGSLSLHVELRDGEKVIAQGSTGCRLPAVTEHHPADSDQAMGALPFDPAKDAPAGTVTLRGLGGNVFFFDM